MRCSDRVRAGEACGALRTPPLATPAASAMRDFDPPQAAFSRLVMFSTVLLACFGLGAAHLYGTLPPTQRASPCDRQGAANLHRRERPLSSQRRFTRSKARCCCDIPQSGADPTRRTRPVTRRRSSPCIARTTSTARLAAAADTSTAPRAASRPHSAPMTSPARVAAREARCAARCTEHLTKRFSGTPPALPLLIRSPSAINPSLSLRGRGTSGSRRPCSLRPSPLPTRCPICSTMWSPRPYSSRYRARTVPHRHCQSQEGSPAMCSCATRQPVAAAAAARAAARAAALRCRCRCIRRPSASTAIASASVRGVALCSSPRRHRPSPSSAAATANTAHCPSPIDQRPASALAIASIAQPSASARQTAAPKQAEAAAAVANAAA